MMITDYILEDLDFQRWDATSHVLESLTMEYAKETTRFQYELQEYENQLITEGATAAPSNIRLTGHNIISRLFQLIRKFCQLMKNWLKHGKDIIGGILSKMHKNGAKKSASAIAYEQLRKRMDPNKSVKEATARVRLPFGGSESEHTIVLQNSAFLVTEFVNDQEFEIGLFSGLEYMKDSDGRSVGMPYKGDGVRPLESVIHEGIRTLAMIKYPDVMERLNIVVKIASEFANGNISTNQEGFRKQSKWVRTHMEHPFNVFKAGKTKLSLKELTEFQARISELSKILDDVQNINNELSGLEKSTIEEMNKLVKLLERVQFGMVTFTNLLQKVHLIDLKFMNSIGDRDQLSRFVDSMISNGIPPKFVAYNSWLIAKETIRGDDAEYSPKGGQSRVVFFPTDNKDECLKVATSGIGITSNRNEHRFSNAVKQLGDAEFKKKVACVNHAYYNDAIIAMERAVDKVGKHPDVKTMMLVKKEFKDFVEGHPELHVQITDFNDGNIMWSSDRNCWVCIDYGFSNRKK